MQAIPPPDINWFSERFSELSEEMIENWHDMGDPTVGDEPSPELLSSAMEQLVELFHLIDRGLPQTASEFAEVPDLTELGGYGLSIVEEFVELAEAFNQKEQIPEWESLAIALCRWVLLHGGEISILSAVVNGLARIANSSSEQQTLEQTYQVMSDITEGVSLSLVDTDHSDESLEPWRILLFNRAITATRIFSPRLMEEAFNSITDYFPGEAAGFFREGMEQLDIESYPREVQEVIERYYVNWPVKRTLH